MICLAVRVRGFGAGLAFWGLRGNRLGSLFLEFGDRLAYCVAGYCFGAWYSDCADCAFLGIIWCLKVCINMRQFRSLFKNMFRLCLVVSRRAVGWPRR